MHATGLTRAAEGLQRSRRLLPAQALPAIVRWRVDRLWADAAFRDVQQREMRFLLEHTERADEAAQLARGYAEQMMLRAYIRWHPNVVTRQRVEGIEWLTTRRDPRRGVVLSFLHHNRYEGLFGSLSRLGAPCHVLVAPWIVDPARDIGMRQHLGLMGHGGTLVPAVGGTDAIASVLRPGVTLAIASDVPGHTPVTFLGRRVLGSFGAARIATMTNSPVVLATHERDGAGAFVRIHQPLEPADFVDPRELLDEMLVRHGAAVLAWPEALEVPQSRWGLLEEHAPN